MKHLALLKALDACAEGTKFAAGFPDLKTAWESCKRSDWMLWFLSEIDHQNDREYRLFACWCIRNTKLQDGRTVWDLLTDKRSREVVEVAERFALGEATESELAAARDAAMDAAWSAARDAAMDAAWSAARDAAWDAAWSAAMDAAMDAAWSAAMDAARDAAWDAAWSAAMDAAWSAAWSAAMDAAWSAAWSAARDAAWDAAMAAARDAAWDAQAAHLREVIAWEDVEKSITRYQKENAE